MICPDCANGADIAVSAIALKSPDLTAIVDANHHLCRIRNRNREPGQHADCTCQHGDTRAEPTREATTRAVGAEPEDVTHA